MNSSNKVELYRGIIDNGGFCNPGWCTGCYHSLGKNNYSCTLHIKLSGIKDSPIVDSHLIKREYCHRELYNREKKLERILNSED